jgi:hypothetical protein
MSSSEPAAAASRFLRTLCLALAALAGAILLLTWAVDPTGLIQASGLPGTMCRPGIRTQDERFVKPRLLSVLAPEEVILGSSRAANGFRADAFPGGQVVNLGFKAQSLEELDALARHAAGRASVRRLWIGLDFGAFIQRESRHEPLGFPDPRLGARASAVRSGLFDQRALKSTILWTLSPGSCLAPPVTPAGFQADDSPPAPQSAAYNALLRTLTIRLWTQPAAERERLHALRRDRLDRLLGHLARRDKAMVLYLSPMAPGFRRIVAELGLAGEYGRWRADMRRLAERHGAVLVESDTASFLAAVPVAHCPGLGRIDCLFMDVGHFRPETGAAIVRAALAQQSAPRAPRPARLPPRL